MNWRHKMYTTRKITCAAVLLAALIQNLTTLAQAADDVKSAAEKEQELIAVLRSDAPGSEKAIACKGLAIHGSSTAVPDLAKLLPNPQLSSWARIALEVIPDNASDDALRNAAGSLNGLLLVGTINSIGVREDAKAVDLLTKKLHDTDDEVASAAAVALGHIGNDTATKSLRAALAAVPAKVRSAVAEGCILCAERLHKKGDTVVAAEIYDEVRNANVPKQRILEATRGAILARNQNGIPLLLELFQTNDKAMFQLALGTVREYPGNTVDPFLPEAVSRATPERAVLIIQAMADRPKYVDLPAVLKAAEQGPKQVRLSAIDALRRVGDGSCLSTLLEIAVGADPELAQAAKVTLADLPGQNVSREVVGLLPTSKGKTHMLLLQLVGERRINAVEEVEKALAHPDKSVRSAALIALGETVSLKKLDVLISQVLAPRNSADATVARHALKTACVRMPDRDGCAAKLANALQQSSPGSKTALLEILSDVGGKKALQTLATAAKSNDPQLQDDGSRLLGKWNDLDVAPVLLDLAKTAPAEKFKIRALRGYIGVARKFAMPEQQRVEMCQNAFNVATRTDEQKLLLDVLKLHASPQGLRLATKAMGTRALKPEATQAALAIAQKLGGKGVNMKQLLSGAGLNNVKLEIIKAEYGAGASQKDVTAVLRKRASNLPLITLASTSYNTSFGGDPAPGVVKKLRIQYRINGKSGESSFAENALIVLPMPQ